MRLQSSVVVKDVATSELHLPGRNRWGNPMVEAGTEFMIRVVAEEPRAHEDDFKDVRIRIVPQSTNEREIPRVGREISSPLIGPADLDVPCRRTPPRVWGFIKPSAEVAAKFRTQLDHCGSVSEAAEFVLVELGFAPTKADIADVISAVAGSETQEAQAESFKRWYRASVFGNSLLSEGWAQCKMSLRGKRNRFLEETLEIPKDRWGFNDDEWGGVMPDMGVMRQHVSCLTKRHLASIWNSRDTIPEKPHVDDKASGSQEAKPDVTSDRSPPTALRLDDPEIVDEATLLAVAEALAGGMAKQYMSKMLPNEAFGEAERVSWVQESTVERSLGASLEQVLMHRLAGYYKFTLSEETVMARNAREAAAVAREAAAADWMEDWRKHGPKAARPPENVYLTEVTKVVLKTTIKQEVARFMELQLVPLVQTQLREHIVPACALTVKTMAWEFVQRRWLGLGLVGTSFVGMAAFTIFAPWVGVFVLFRRLERPQ